MAEWYRFIATSDDWTARTLRKTYRAVNALSVPAPSVLTRPALTAVVGIRSLYYFAARVFFAEPLFKAYCHSYGRNLRTGVFLHWVQGKGDIVLGDDVTIDGRCHFHFASRYCERPRISIGDHTGIGHNCSFVVGKSITIGKHCRIASAVQMLDAPGHPSDPAARLAGKPADPEQVQPIVIGDNVWIGTSSIIYPGVNIGDNSIVSMGSVLMTNVPANTVVAGNPARQVRSLAATS